MKNVYDVAIIGAGAAGLKTAMHVGEAGLNVLLLDGQPKIGAKILMSGGTRCNVTNKVVSEKDYSSNEERIVRNILRAYPSAKAMEFFKGIGINLIEEPGGKFFPDTHSGKTVLDAFIKNLPSTVALKILHKVSTIDFQQDIFIIKGSGFSYEAKAIVLCSGGLSYPTTGSDGVGYRLAKHFGHSVVNTTAALTPFLTDDERWKSISGVALPVRLDLFVNEKKEESFESPFLFTHFGFSGTACLNMSRYWDRLRTNSKVSLFADFLPSYSAQQFRQLFIDAPAKKSIKNFLTEYVPERFAVALLEKTAINISITMAELTKEKREALIRNLFNYPLEVKGIFGYAKAEVTAGGVSLTEIDYQTMQSKLQKGLFFAGEILDCDGRIGGFNFQWAWATGFLAAQGVIKYLRN